MAGSASTTRHTTAPSPSCFPDPHGSCDHTIHGHHHHNRWDHSIAPVLEVESGATVEFETLDASGGQVDPHSTVAALATLYFGKVNPGEVCGTAIESPMPPATR